jgi:formate-dependent nitrite reductase membrane component NrfD
LTTTRIRYEQFLADLASEYRPQRQWSEGRGVFLIVGHFLVGVAGGAWVYGDVLGVPASLAIAYLLAALGGIAHLFNLARPGRFWRMTVQVRTSWVARGFWGLSLFLVGGLLYVPPLLVSGLPWSDAAWPAQIGHVMAWAGALVMIGYMGFVYSTSKGIPFWHSPLHPVLYIAYALRGGAATLLILAAIFDLPVNPLAGLLQSWIVVTAMVVMLWAFELHMVTTSGDPAARRSVHELFRGRLVSYVYGGILFVGLLVPMTLVIGFVAQLSHATLAAIGVASVIGDFFMKYASIKAGVHLSVRLARP